MTQTAATPQNGLSFGWVDVEGTPRAYIDDAAYGGTSVRLYIYLIWQEEWTTNPLARKPFIRGKVVYQLDPSTRAYFAKRYEYSNARLSLSGEGERLPAAIVPPDSLKRMAAEPESPGRAASSPGRR